MASKATIQASTPGSPFSTSKPTVNSTDIASLTLLNELPIFLRLYVLPWLVVYPVAAWAYYLHYDEYIGGEEWTFLFSVFLFGLHGLSWLGTKWSVNFRSATTCVRTGSVYSAQEVLVIPHKHKGQGEIVPLLKEERPGIGSTTYFLYQRDKYNYTPETNSFSRLSYPADSSPTLSTFQSTRGLLTPESITSSKGDYGKNIFDIPVPTFRELFAEHAIAPFFVFQIFCVGLWFVDEYWYYSLFTLFMLVTFECTVVFQRLRTLGEFRTMSIKPYKVNVFRESKWVEILSDELLPGDLVSIVRTRDDSGVPCDLLLLRGSCIVNEAMLSGESTPLLKESIELRPGNDKLDINGSDRNSVLFGGTKVLQATKPSGVGVGSDLGGVGDTPDGGCVATVLRTGFGTSQGQLVRTMIFATERVSANNFESFLFICFLLIFAIAASAYVWIKGVEHDRKRTKLLLDCVIIITSVVPPELPMELSMAVNASLVALSKYAIFCTEPFRIPFAGRVDVCCFDKTGTITGEDLVVEGVAGIEKKDSKKLVSVKDSGLETCLTLASAHALVLLDDGVVGDPMEKTTLDALEWKLSTGDRISPSKEGSKHKAQIFIKRRYQFSSSLKRMSTVSNVDFGNRRQLFVAVKGAPETLKGMYKDVPGNYDETYKWFTRRGSRVLALGYKYLESMGEEKISKLPRENVEGGLTFAGFLVFHCPLKPDAISTLKALHDSSHRSVMITGDNPLTAVHVAREVEIVDRDVLILDLKEGATKEDDLAWRTVDESKIIPVNPSEPLDISLLDEYDICITGAAMKQFVDKPSWQQLVQTTWVYARVSPSQKEFILTTLKSLGYVTLMAGDGTNDVGALKQANIGVALLDGSPEDLKKIAEHAKIERLKKVYDQQLKISARFNAPPPPVPKALEHLYPDAVKAQKEAAQSVTDARRANQLKKFDLDSITSKMAEMEEEDQPPTIKLGDASVAAPFTSKLSNVVAVANIIRQGRCTLVATIQMYKILALNCLISAYSLSVMYLDGIKFGDYQVTITGMLMSVCFLCISRAKPIEKLSKERPLGNIFNFYVLLSVLAQFAIHIASLIYISNLSEQHEPRSEKVDLEAEFKPSLLNSAVYLISLSQQVSTFAINFQGRPFREGITENRALFYGLAGAGAVAVCGATDFMPEMNRWLQLVEMKWDFQWRLCAAMVLDYGGAWLAEIVIKSIFADNRPKAIVLKGADRREKRRALEEAAAIQEGGAMAINGVDTKKSQ